MLFKFERMEVIFCSAKDVYNIIGVRFTRYMLDLKRITAPSFYPRQVPPPSIAIHYDLVILRNLGFASMRVQEKACKVVYFIYCSRRW